MRIVIGDGQALLQVALAELLSAAGHEVVGVAGDGPELVLRSRREHPQLVIADVRMPPSGRDDGLRAAHRIRVAAPVTAVFLLSHHLQVAYAVELLALDARGVGYLLKHRVADVERFLAAVEQVGAGGTVVDEEVVAVMLGRLHAAPLGAVERDVLARVAQGDSDAAIATQLALAAPDLAGRVEAAFRVLGLAPPPEGHERISALARRATR